MANFVFQGENISEQTLSVAKNSNLQIGIWGPMNNFVSPAVEIEPEAEDKGVVLIAKAGKPITNNIRLWNIKGLSTGTTKINAVTTNINEDDENWDTITVNVIDSLELAFIQNLYMEAAKTSLKFKLPVSIMIAQACLESHYGKNARAKAHNTLYGITKRVELSKGKERDWYPSCQKILKSPTEVERTVEENGEKKRKLVKVYDLFCSAFSYKEAVQIWGEYVTNHPRTDKHLFVDPPWSEEHLRAVGKLMARIGFGSTLLGDYSNELMSIIRTYNLRQYDPK